ncbi:MULTISPECIES: hypothetical protein [unclassified Streptomyces]|uniref:hypothetical protein n=1 Tax=unclassified Streptomyces TaxID=2593676 RepID=UPI00109CCFCD|nr:MULTISPECIES: hypothetical protein [unclassified Streptomyces]MCE3035751.1 hypothetical protein [Streptomyces sp. CMSTAAHL-2]TGZ12897.1 hypothetical protein DV517_69810 [Streptomyces sp. S816]
MSTTFTMPTSPETLELLGSIADEMVSEFGITRAEAVARINAHWHGQDLSDEDCLVPHEDERFWAFVIYYGRNVPDWSPGADRSGWVPTEPPAAGSEYWTVRG